MATLFLKTGATNFNAAGSWSNVNASGVDNSGPPANTDDCIAETLSGNVTVNAGSVCKSFDTTSGTGSYGGVITHTAGVTWTISGSFKLNSGVTYTLGNAATSALAINATGTLTSGTRTIGNFTNTVGTLTLGDDIVCNSWTHTSGGLTHNSKNITIQGDVTTFVTGARTYFGVTMNSITMTISGGGSFTNFTRTGTSSKNSVLTVANSFTVTGTLLFNGNSSVNRLLVRTTTMGTTSTITVTGATANGGNNYDLRDLLFNNGGSNLDLTNSGANLVGDINGNGMSGGGTLTTTTPATQTWSGTGGGNWSANAWSGRAPLPQDDVVINAAFVATPTVTFDMPRLGKNLDFSGLSGSPVFSANSIGMTLYGSLKLGPFNSSFGGSTGSLTFEGRSNYTCTCAGKSQGPLTIAMFGGQLTFLDAYTGIVSGSWTQNNGTIIDGGFSHSIANYNSSNSNLRALTRSGTWSISSTNVPWTLTTSTNMTLTDTGTSIVSDTGATTKTFAGGALTYNDVKKAFNGTASDLLAITGANTFNRIYTDGGGTGTIRLPGSTTTTIASGQGLGNGTNVITIVASAGSATVSKSGGGTVSMDYLNLTNIPAVQATTWYAGTHSTDGGGNTNWVFTAPPSGGTARMLTLLGVG